MVETKRARALVKSRKIEFSENAIGLVVFLLFLAVIILLYCFKRHYRHTVGSLAVGVAPPILYRSSVYIFVGGLLKYLLLFNYEN